VGRPAFEAHVKTVEVSVHFVACGCGWYGLSREITGLPEMLAAHRVVGKCESRSSHIGSRHFTARPWAEGR
jgi:hypothetical protein